MSAYMVNRHHITYLVAAAMSHRICRDGLRWRHAGVSQQLRAMDYERAAEIAQMLWDENLKSIESRYPDSKKSRKLPGPIGEDYEIRPADLERCWMEFDPLQVIMSIHCLEYQSCEHPEWPDSEAYAFLKALEHQAINAIPGFEDCKWGAPEPEDGPVNLTARMLRGKGI